VTGVCEGGECLGGVVLAAGRSLRLGTPKQLLALGGEALVRRAARAAVEAGLWPVVVVVGDHADEVRASLAGLPIATVSNPDHADGVAGSLRRGLDRLAECAPEAVGVVVLACDQPRVSAGHVEALVAAWRREHRPIAASSYAEAVGLPALFAAAVIPELHALTADEEARAVVGRDLARVCAVPLAGGELDVDTAEDWARARRG
jgi:molybdenum cofactor cytidylyltransferase